MLKVGVSLKLFLYSLDFKNNFKTIVSKGSDKFEKCLYLIYYKPY